MKQSVVSLSSLSTSMDHYLQGHVPAELKLSSADEKTRSRLPARWAQWLVVQLHQQPWLVRAEAIEMILRTWRARRHEPTAQAQYAAFKKALRQPWQDWQGRLLGVHWHIQVRVHHVPFMVNHELSVPLTEVKRHQLVSGKHSTQAALIGTNFTHYPRSGTGESRVLSPVLDAGFSASVLDAEGEHRGFVLTLGDGAGGHFGDPSQDRRIGETS